MQKFFEKLKQFFGRTRRQRFTAIATLVVANILVAAGVFAYFNSSDMVTNRMTADHPSIVLLEPTWDSEGQYMAKKSEPGMNIPKDPCAMNDGDISEYCRIKMTVSFSGTNTRQDEGINGQKRLYNIIHAICMSQTQTDRFIEVNADLSVKDNFSKSFMMLKEENSEKDDHSTDTNSSGDVRSVTYYFYYMGTDAEGYRRNVMKVLNPGERTEKLFEYVNLPIYKQDYLGVFDLGYNITLQAESVPAALFEDDPTIEKFKEQLTADTN